MEIEKSTSIRDKKESRYDSLREAEKRAAELRAQPRMYAKTVYDIPIEAPPGWSYAWIRTSIRDGGEQDVKRDSEIKQLGWTPVPASRHPELCLDGVSGMIAKQNGVIHYRGSLLVEIPTCINEERRIYNERIDADKVNSLQLQGILMGNPDMPLVINQQQTQRAYAVQMTPPSTNAPQRNFGV